jgi:hypothetical protein
LSHVRGLDATALSPEVARIIAECAGALSSALESAAPEGASESPRRLRPELYEAARQYAAGHAAFACLHTWVQNRQRLDPFFAAGEWLALSLHRLARRLGCPVASPPAELYERVAVQLLRLREEGRRFSICPVPQAGGAQP